MNGLVSSAADDFKSDIQKVVNNSKLDISSIEGQWEAFMTQVVDNPLPGIAKAYVIIGSDKRGTIYALYDHSEQFGVSPWYWWADVPVTRHSDIFVSASGCSHGSPTVKYRGIFLNDEQPALQFWAMENCTNGTGAALTGSPFNHLFYTKLFELLLRLKANYLWPAMWSSAFAVDDPQNQPLADSFGIVMGTSHQEPLMRSTPVEWDLFGSGPWDYTMNSKNIYNYWQVGVQRAKPYESIYTIGMRGAGDVPLSETENIGLLEEIVSDQRTLLTDVFSGTDITAIPQMWCLYQEVEGYYEDGIRVDDDMTLLWTDDTWGNIRRYLIASERNRTGGAGVYYHFDLVGDPRDYKWITSTQISKVFEQMSLAVDRKATEIWIVNVGDLKPYEMSIEFFVTYGWNATRWSLTNIDSFVSSWAVREFDLSAQDADTVASIVANLTMYLSRRKPELLNSTMFNLVNYREADNVLAAWDSLNHSASRNYNNLASDMQPAFFELVFHPVQAGYTLTKLWISAGVNNLRASQARVSANDYAEQVEQLFEMDYDLEHEYQTILNGILDAYTPFNSRFVDVSAGGSIPFTFTATSNASWLSITPAEGSLSNFNPEHGFKGFVEGDGGIAIEAAHATRNTTVGEVTWREIPNYGKTLSGVTPWPRLGNNESNYTVVAPTYREYDFYNFNTISETGNVTVTVYVSPSLNANGQDRPLALGVQIDSEPPQTTYFTPALGHRVGARRLGRSRWFRRTALYR
ncbi:hypothetical protein EW146_g1901 [Bondarzewia mesenterica]|uniref:Gylcosyl hydrolase 115 C-terminal domain-containing protein n=1 Tax=Bondarzewia mesenterica TaxID=1095465 RepID=A0A4S4M3S8_9AGAM|nr:hypothetical protein EW146_g1901 [Bondarzewia mesenterica]